MKKFAIILAALLLVTSFVACGKDKTPAVPTITAEPSEIWTKVVEACGGEENLPAFMPGDIATLEMVYGLTAEDVEEGFVWMAPMMNVQATEFFIAKVKEGKMDTVKAGIESRQKYVAQMFERYLADQYELVQNYKLEVVGDYVFFAIAHQADAAVEAFKSFAK